MLHMQKKLLNLGVILSSLIGYLEWGDGMHAFLFEAEAEMLSKLRSDPAGVLHPFTLIPLLGQILLIFTLFQGTPNRILTLSGVGCLCLLYLMMAFIGIIGGNIRIILSTVPFLVFGFIAVRSHWKRPVRM